MKYFPVYFGTTNKCLVIYFLFKYSADVILGRKLSRDFSSDNIICGLLGDYVTKLCVGPEPAPISLNKFKVPSTISKCFPLTFPGILRISLHIFQPILQFSRAFQLFKVQNKNYVLFKQSCLCFFPTKCESERFM